MVEDDGPTREFIAESLMDRGYLVDTAADAAEARARVAHSLPELVILDLILPGANGFELMAAWRGNSRTADLTVFVLTSKGSDSAGKRLSEREQLLASSQARTLAGIAIPTVASSRSLGTHAEKL